MFGQSSAVAPLVDGSSSANVSRDHFQDVRLADSAAWVPCGVVGSTGSQFDKRSLVYRLSDLQYIPDDSPNIRPLWSHQTASYSEAVLQILRDMAYAPPQQSATQMAGGFGGFGDATYSRPTLEPGCIVEITVGLFGKPQPVRIVRHCHGKLLVLYLAPGRIHWVTSEQVGPLFSHGWEADSDSERAILTDLKLDAQGSSSQPTTSVPKPTVHRASLTSPPSPAGCTSATEYSFAGLSFASPVVSVAIPTAQQRTDGLVSVSAFSLSATAPADAAAATPELRSPVVAADATSTASAVSSGSTQPVADVSRDKPNSTPPQATISAAVNKPVVSSAVKSEPANSINNIIAPFTFGSGTVFSAGGIHGGGLSFGSSCSSNSTASSFPPLSSSSSSSTTSSSSSSTSIFCPFQAFSVSPAPAPTSSSSAAPSFSFAFTAVPAKSTPASGVAGAAAGASSTSTQVPVSPYPVFRFGQPASFVSPALSIPAPSISPSSVSLGATSAAASSSTSPVACFVQSLSELRLIDAAPNTFEARLSECPVCGMSYEDADHSTCDKVEEPKQKASNECDGSRRTEQSDSEDEPAPPSAWFSLRCRGCDFLFDAESRPPYELHLGHVLCSSCVDMRLAFGCHLCRQSYMATPRRHEPLIRVLRAVPLLAVGECPKRSCSLCKGVVPAVCVCTDKCSAPNSQFLCQFHVQEHKRNVHSHAHRLVTLDSLWSDLSVKVRSSIRRSGHIEHDAAVAVSITFQRLGLSGTERDTSLCWWHSKSYTYMCTTCNVPLCLDCAILGEHGLHSKQPMETALVAIQESMQAASVQLQEARMGAESEYRKLDREVTEQRMYVLRARDAAEAGHFELDEEAVTAARSLGALPELGQLCKLLLRGAESCKLHEATACAHDVLAVGRWLQSETASVLKLTSDTLEQILSLRGLSADWPQSDRPIESFYTLPDKCDSDSESEDGQSHIKLDDEMEAKDDSKTEETREDIDRDEDMEEVDDDEDPNTSDEDEYEARQDRDELTNLLEQPNVAALFAPQQAHELRGDDLFELQTDCYTMRDRLAYVRSLTAGEVTAVQQAEFDDWWRHEEDNLYQDEEEEAMNRGQLDEEEEADEEDDDRDALMDMIRDSVKFVSALSFEAQLTQLLPVPLQQLDEDDWAEELNLDQLQALLDAVEELAEQAEDQVDKAMHELSAGPHVAVEVVLKAIAQMRPLNTVCFARAQRLREMADKDQQDVDDVMHEQDALSIDMDQVRSSRSTMESMARSILDEMDLDQRVTLKLQIAEAAQLEAVRREQRNTEALLAPEAMSGLLCELLASDTAHRRFTAAAKRALCDAAEAYAISLLEDGNALALSSCCEELQPSHVQLAKRVRGERS